MKVHPWQESIIRGINKVNPETGRTIVRRALLMLPRKSSKSTLAACISTEHLLNTNVGGRVALVAAGDRYQAGLLFKKAKTMIEADPYLNRQCKIYTSSKRIETKQGNSLQVMSSDGKRAAGENPSLVLCDEVFCWPNRELFDVLTSGFGARSEHLTLVISTAGNKREGLLWDEYQYGCKVRDGIIKDPEYLPIIYEAPADADWQSEEVWAKTMPAWDSGFCNKDTIRSDFKKALEVPSEEAKVRQFFLNQWVAGEGKWLNRAKWDVCGTHPVDPEALKGRRCYAGCDLSAKSDITAVVLVFPMDHGTYQVLPHAWIPKEYAKERDRKGYTTYQKQAEMGFITLTDGFYINEDAIVEKIVALGKDYKIKKILFDEWSATRPATLLESQGYKTGFMSQSNSKMNEPVKYLETLIATEKLHHGNHPILNIHADNTAINSDRHGNVRFDKQSSHDKIDLMVALAMGTALAMVEKPKKPSPYQDAIPMILSI